MINLFLQAVQSDSDVLSAIIFVMSLISITIFIWIVVKFVRLCKNVNSIEEKLDEIIGYKRDEYVDRKKSQDHAS